jgi:hypothetical protein
VNIKNGEESRDLNQVVDLARQVQQLQLAAAAFSGGEAADELADSLANEIVHVGQV